MAPKTGLVDAFVLLRCSQKKHDDCSAMQELLINNFINAKSTSMIETTHENKYCVMATVKLEPEWVDRFKRRLRQVKSDDGVRVSDFRIEQVQS